MDQLYLPVTIPSSRATKFRRLTGRSLIAAFLVLCALVFDLSPSITEPKAPSAEQARRARDVLRRTQIDLDAGKGFATLQVDRNDLTSAATLASSLGKFGRFDTSLDGGSLTLRSSRVFGPVWLNVEARIVSSPRGLSETRLKIGDLSLGRWLSAVLIDGVRLVLHWRGIAIPPLNDLVQSVRIQPDMLSARVHFPLGIKFANEFANQRDEPIDAALTAALYCRLIRFDRDDPSGDFAIIVRRAFMRSGSALASTEQNRAALVAIAMYAVSPDAGRLAGDATRRAGKCAGAPTIALLAGRADLAKHWAMSAALAVSLGDDIGNAMGEWKELSDSRQGGSGFSFVDLAADRAGIAAARRATDVTTANTTAIRLRVATSNDLLPVRALALSEGLSDRQFVGTYRTVGSAQFTAAKARIDRVIGETIGRTG